MDAYGLGRVVGEKGVLPQRAKKLDPSLPLRDGELLIDGQQRVTTITLLLIALRDHLIESGWAGEEDGPTSERVEAYFLKNLQQPVR